MKICKIGDTITTEILVRQGAECVVVRLAKGLQWSLAKVRMQGRLEMRTRLKANGAQSLF